MSKGGSRRRSTADGGSTGGGGPRAAAAPPEPEPASAAAARRLVGRGVEKVFMDDALGKCRAFKGVIEQVMTSRTRADGTTDPRFYYFVSYEDGDSEHMLWPELSAVLQPPDADGAADGEDGAAAATAAKGGKKGKQARGIKSEPGAAEKEEEAAPAAPTTATTTGKKRLGSTAGRPAAAAAGAVADGAGADDDAAPPTTTAKRARKVNMPAVNADNADNAADNADQPPPAAADGPAASDAPMLSAGGGADADADAANDDGGEGAIAGIDSRVRARGLPGHLRRVRLRNFMCHANFEMEFGAHVNVVSGTNGSGKSAVLQAVQACLGASAKVTGRATSIGDFVRTGSDEALVSVELWNAGEDGYDAARLGDRVTIERRIAAGSGASQWRVLDARGRVVATGAAAKKRLIDPLLDHLSVNAANPMAAMTQDTARTFLSSGATGPQRRFELFMEATMLALFKANLDAARSYAAQMSARVEEVLRDHTARVGRRREAERKLALLDEAKEAAANVGALERAAAWAHAAEGQAQVRALRRRVDVVIPERLTMLRVGRKGGLKETDVLNAEVKTLQDRQTKAVAMAERFARAEAASSKQLKDAKAEAVQSEQDLKGARKALKDAELELQRHRDETAAATAGQRAALAPQMASQEQGRDAAEQRRREAQEAREAKEAALAEAKARKEQLEQDLRSAMESAITFAGQRTRAAEELAQARAEGTSALAPYRTRWLRARVDELEASGRSPFKLPPIGPLGAHVSAADGRWHLALSALTAGTLDQWIVGCVEDLKALEDLAREAKEAHARLPQQGQRPPAPVGPTLTHVCAYGAPRYAVGPQHRPAPPYGCALDKLAVSHPTHADVIFNLMVDSLALERVALVGDKAEADGAVLGGRAGAGCSKAVDPSGCVLQRYGATVSMSREYFKPPAQVRLRVTSASGGGAEQTIAVLEAQHAEAGRRIAEAGRREAELKEELRAAEAAFVAVGKEWGDLRKTEQILRRAVEKHTVEIQDTQGLMDAALDVDDDDDDDQHRQGATQTVTRLGRQRSEAVDAARARVERLQREACEARAAAERAQAAMDAAETNLRSEGGLGADELEALGEELKVAIEKRKLVQEQIKKMEVQMALYEKEAADLKPVADAAERDVLPPLLAAARRVCDDAQGAADLVRAKEICLEAARRRVDADTKKSVQRLPPEQKLQRAVDEAERDFGAEWACEHLDALDNRLRDAEEEAGGSREHIEHERDMLRAEIRRQAVIVRNLRSTNDVVQAQVTRRARAYDDLFGSVEQTVRHKFELFMARRHHTGMLRISREGAAPSLDILVVPNGARGGGGAAGGAGGRTAQAARDLRQLSGGERSFTTVAFMLALGEWTESPFRAADELDVFMDAVNRRVAMEAVLEFAAERDHLQMILLTPQDLQAVEDAKASLARRRARRARQARRQQQREEEEAAGAANGGGGGDDDDDDVDEAEEAAAALPEGFVRVLKMPSARDAGGVRGSRHQAAAAAAAQ